MSSTHAEPNIEDVLIDRTMALCRHAKAADLPVTQSRVLDVFRALRHVDWLNEGDYRLAVRINLASNKENEVAFDRVFRAFWHEMDAEDGNYKPWRPELVRGEKSHGENRAHEEMRTERERFGAEEVVREHNLASRWDESAPPLETVIKELAKRLATRPSRRYRRAAHARKIDLRRSVRRNVRHGMDMLELSRVKRRVRKTRIVLLSDVSGSMDAFNPFLLQLMLGLQQALKNSRTLVFSTQLSEITTMLRTGNVTKTLSEIGTKVRHWSGGTDIGAALAKLNRGILREGSTRATVAIIISDGYDNGSSEQIEQEMRAMRRRVRKIVWINPMYGASTFEVRAAGMKAALPFVDHFLPAFNAQSLKVLVRELAKI